MITRNPNFMFREAELLRILDRLSEGQSVLLAGIRRTGKTELVKAVLAKLPKQTEAVYLDVQDYTSLTIFYSDLLRHMPKDVASMLQQSLTALRLAPSKLIDWFRTQVDNVSASEVTVEFRPPDDDLQRYWEPIVEQLAKILAKTPTEQLPVIAIDELPFFIENLLARNYQTHDIEVLLASLRKLRSNGLRFIIAGSINLEHLLSSLNIPKTVLGGLWHETLPPFNDNEAESYLKTRLQGTTAADSESIKLILQYLPDYVPQCLETAVGYLKFNPTLTECEQLLNNKVLPHLQRSFVYQFEERLAKHYTPTEQAVAEQILDELARGANEPRLLPPELVSGADRAVLVKLQLHDFITQAADYRWCFTLNMIRLWWRATRSLT
jgi:tRNA A37 threonylcarbamoyladenosine biosynthesis protein TsaE